MDENTRDHLSSLSDGQPIIPQLGYTTCLGFFEYSHLPEDLQYVSKPICELANLMDDMLPDGPEKSAGLRKLLEAKDCFVRANLTPATQVK